MSESEAVIAAVDALAYWACCSGDTQFLLGQMISDDAWVDAYIAQMRARLGEAYQSVTDALEEEKIPYLPAEAGFFFLCDLRRFMAGQTSGRRGRALAPDAGEGEREPDPGLGMPDRGARVHAALLRRCPHRHRGPRGGGARPRAQPLRLAPETGQARPMRGAVS